MKDESIFLVLFFFTVLVSFLVSAEMQGTTAASVAENQEDRCHDPRLEAEWQRMLDEAPGDPVMLKSHALRAGLCQMVENGEISPQQAAEIWSPETPERAVSHRSY